MKNDGFKQYKPEFLIYRDVGFVVRFKANRHIAAYLVKHCVQQTASPARFRHADVLDVAIGLGIVERLGHLLGNRNVFHSDLGFFAADRFEKRYGEKRIGKQRRQTSFPALVVGTNDRAYRRKILVGIGVSLAERHFNLEKIVNLLFQVPFRAQKRGIKRIIFKHFRKNCASSVDIVVLDKFHLIAHAMMISYYCKKINLLSGLVYINIDILRIDC